MPREREGFKAVNWWLPDELVDRLTEFRHYNRIETMTEAAAKLLDEALQRWEADPDHVPVLEKLDWRNEAEVWRDNLLTRFAAEMQEDNAADYVVRTVEPRSPFVSVLVRPNWAKSHFDLRAVVDLRANGLVELRVEARFADMHRGTERRQRAERDVDALLDPNRSLIPPFEPKPGLTQFKRQRLLREPIAFADRPGDDWIITEFGRYINALDQCLEPAVRRYYQ